MTGKLFSTCYTEIVRTIVWIEKRRQRLKVDTKQSYDKRMLKVQLYIQNNLYAELSLDELASVASFSNYHFHRIFKGMVGESVKEYVRRLRIERAASQLIYGDRAVTELAFEAGYESLESFSRAFKSRFSTTPSQFRKEFSAKKEFKIESINFSKGDELMRDYKVKKVNEKKVVFVRHIGPYNQCQSAWEKLCSWAGSQGLMTGKTEFLGLSYDDPDVTEENKIRYDACITLDREVTPPEGIEVQVIPAGEYVVTVHKGSFSKLHETYAEMCGQIVPEEGKEIRNAPSIELYLNSPENVAEEELLTEVWVPVE